MAEDQVYHRTVQYYETDQMGIVNHANYIHWFEEARIWMLGEIGFSYAKMEKAGVMIPVLNVNCDYKHAVRFGETVLIQVDLIKFNGIQMSIAYHVYDESQEELKALGSSKHCFLDTETGKLLNLKKAYPTIYQLLDSHLSEEI